MDVEMDPGLSAIFRKERVEHTHLDHLVLTVGGTHKEPQVLTVVDIHRGPRAQTGAGQHMYKDHQLEIHQLDHL